MNMQDRMTSSKQQDMNENKTMDKSVNLTSNTFSAQEKNSSVNSQPLTYDKVLQLQTTLGNQAVIQLFNKLGIPKGNPMTVQMKKDNNMGLPDKLKTGVENLSGISMDEVRVHYNSSKPEEVGALAYAQGADIHVAPGQEKHLPHEAWHVVQQAQGRVKPTVQLKDMTVNDDVSLEKEADDMGGRASLVSRVSLSPVKQEKSIYNLSKSLMRRAIQFQWGKKDTLADHYTRHGADFSASSEADYVAKADKFFTDRSKCQEKKVDGKIKLYDPKTNTFGVYFPSGEVVTFFKPSGKQVYFDAQ